MFTPFEKSQRFYCFREILSSKIVSRPDRQLVCPAIAPVSCPPVRGAVSSVHTGHHLCVFPHTAVSSDQCSPRIQSLTYPLICQAQFMRKWGPQGGGSARETQQSLRNDRRRISDEHPQRCREIRTQKCRYISQQIQHFSSR